MKAADYIIQKLADKGIKEVFQVYGAASGDLVDAFTRIKSIRYIAMQHEQGAGFAAEGYAKTSGNFGVAIATSGPGGQNFVTPIANCFYDSVPCLFITGQVKTEFMRKDKSIRQIGFQETDIISIVKPITKYAKTILNPNDIRFELEKALFLMKDGRPGPVLLDLPIDIQKADIDPEKLGSYTPEQLFPTIKYYGDKVFNDLISDIQKSQRPCLLIGGGAKGSEVAIREISMLLGIPCLRTWNAKDIIPNDFMHFAGDVGTYGGLGRNFAVQNCDLLICLGTRISGRITGGNPKSFAREAKKWLIDVDPATKRACVEQGVDIDNFVISNAQEFCDDFLKFINQSGLYSTNHFIFANWLSKTKEWVRKYDPVDLHKDSNFKNVNPYIFCRKLSYQCQAEDVIVSEVGGNVVIMNHSFVIKSGQKFITNNGNSAMGQGLGIGIGAWFAQQDKGNIICVVGDGGLSMAISEFQTIKQYGVNIKIIVLDNHCYGITRAFQRDNFNGREEACCPASGWSHPDFTKIAEVYGIKSIWVDKNIEIDEAISAVLNSDDAILCVVNCKDWASYFPKTTGWKTPIEDNSPHLPRDEFKSNMIIQPLPGWKDHAYK